MLIGIIVLSLIVLILIYLMFSRREGHAMFAKISEGNLQSNAKDLAISMRMPDAVGSSPKVMPILRKFRTAYRSIKSKVNSDAELYEFERWIYENYYAVTKLINIRAYKNFALLPHKNKQTRVLAATDLIVNASYGEVTKDVINTVINTFNTHTPLHIEEIEALKDALTFSLLCKIVDISAKIKHYEKMKKLADGKAVSEKYAASDCYLYWLKRNGQVIATKEILKRSDINIDNIEYSFSTTLIDNCIIVSGCIKSIKELKNIFTKAATVDLTYANSLMMADKIYASMDTSSKMIYLRALDKLAGQFNVSEKSIIDSAMALSCEHGEHFGRYIFENKVLIKAYLLSKKTSKIHLKNTDSLQRLYIATVFALNTLLSAVLGLLTWNIGWGIAVFVLSGLASLPLVESIVQKAHKSILSKRPTPKLDMEEIPDDLRTLVVVPCYVASEVQIKEICDNIKAQRAINCGKNIEYTLLLDYAKGNGSTMPEDYKWNSVFAENLRNCTDINCFVRRRRKVGNYYSGFERKRGAIADFNDMLLTDNRNAFSYVLHKEFSKPELICVLDADSKLMPHSLHDAIATMAHPLNNKYDLMAFGSKFDMYSLDTIYSKQYYFDSGYESYNNYSSYYYDAFDRAVFCGKGIYRLGSFYNKINKKLPNGKVLSHDIIEGAMMNCGCLNECVFEDAPKNMVSETVRNNRWLAGDIQLTSFVKIKIKGEDGKKNKIEKKPIYNYLMLTNMLKGLVPMAMLSLVLISLFTLNLWFSMPVIAIFGGKMLLDILDKIAGVGKGIRTKYVFRGILRATLNAVINFFMLPLHAVNNAMVFVKQLYKMMFDKSGEIKWTTFFEGQGKYSLSNYFAMIIPSFIVMIGVSLIGMNNLWVLGYIAYYFAITIAMYPLGVKENSRTKLSDTQKNLMKMYARKTYNYFDLMRSGNNLICDNYQVSPYKGKSIGTSPTNIGFSLLAEVSAAELEIIDRQKAADNIAAILDSINRLEKYNGHLYNWYNIASTEVMHPRYVSSVDSANFVASLITTKGFLSQNDLIGADKCQQLIDATDFGCLFDEIIGQFYIGYDVPGGVYSGHYDLLASEAQILNYIASVSSRKTNAWLSLARNITAAGGNILLSWSGTMFEYLMPTIFFKPPSGSLINSSNIGAIKVQRRHKCRGFFGISESGYYKFDNALNYQYHAFGDNSLALRAESNRCVISPYSSFLAMQYEVDASLNNLYGLYQESMFGDFGFYEAIDFTDDKHIIYSYMAHHQGMVMASLCNVLKGGAINKYFMSDSRMRGGRLVLCERKSLNKTDKKPHEDYVYTTQSDCSKLFMSYQFSLPPKVAMLTRGDYSVVINALGSGVSRCGDVCVNKLREGVFDNSGVEIIFENSKKEQFSPYPTLATEDYSDYFFNTSYKSATLKNNKHNVTESVYVPHCICGEVREFAVHNKTDSMEQYKFNIYSDIAIASSDAEQAHPIFSDMFISTTLVQAQNTVIYHRNAREKDGDVYCAVTLLTNVDCNMTSNRFNTDKHLGGSGHKLKDFGDVMYPCFSATGGFELPPQASKSIYIAIIYSNSITELESMISATQEEHFISYAKKSAEINALSHVGRLIKSENDFERASIIASAVLYRGYSLTSQQKIYDNDMTNCLAKLGISDRYKILTIEYLDNDSEVKSAASIVRYLNMCGINVALMICYAEKDKYHKPVLGKLIDITGGVFAHIKLVDKMSDDAAACEFAFAEYKLIMDICKDWVIGKKLSMTTEKSQYIDPPKIVTASGCGGFDEEGNYIITSKPQLPYSNVVCLKCGGFITTERGGGYYYTNNSRQNKLTAFDNDPITDESHEIVAVGYDSKIIKINRLQPDGYVKHCTGSTEFNCKYEGVTYCTEEYLLADGKVKIYQIEVINAGYKEINRDIILAVTPCLGVTPRQGMYNAKSIDNVVCVTRADAKEKLYLTAVNGDMVLEYNNNHLNADKLEEKYTIGLENKVMLKCNINILPSGRRTIYYAVSQDRELLSNLNVPIVHEQKRISMEYFAKINRVSMLSNNKSCDLMINKYLMYQVVSSRLNGRCGYYQAGGAVGFRDQLQDCLAMLYADPAYVRHHILECAKRQFVEGDVLHWWHPINLGVRTTISDDKLFLPYLVSEYISFTGDSSILSEKVEFLEGEMLASGQESRYQEYNVTAYKDTISRHCMLAIENALKYGEHNLLLIGSGDWNDALNDIGTKGRGESVWLSMFGYSVIKDYMEYMTSEDKIKYLKVMDNLYAAINQQYVGGYYRRACTDEGVWLGESSSSVCKIDLITQAYAVISGVGRHKNNISALNNAYSKLVDNKNGIIKLLTPAFNKEHYAGYISSYPQGVRENGGQYSHAAMWYIKAVAMVGEREKALGLINMINPIAKCADAELNKIYLGEPYVMSGDVYENGQMGWSWYTGSASWMYKIIIEDILGIKIKGATMTIAPQYFACLGDGYVVKVGWKKSVYSIKFVMSNQKSISIDSVKYHSQSKTAVGCNNAPLTIPLVDSGKEYNVIVEY